ncbi:MULTISPECIES: CFI-box-CTERM domain-containing protein [Flavobacteriaceae]|uniref:Uncharacterized protein n=2 Tax=Flavobacteriaceae TaxID=49546 RepID=A0A4Y8ATA4_9FLAO|nr:MULTISPECIES: CFI-box-CTERM domain-containing protein [Flavobacteriaceae]TEW75115.1 hypothetical protein E2488_06225 [Gramella jeungdoensis]GGK41474.1 hypothetical protein GCM10007963_06850 [Lutibacter litoralis]
MATEIVNSIKRLDKRSFSDYNFLVTEVSRSITDLAEQNTAVLRNNKNLEDYTLRSNTVDFLKSEYNNKLREFVNVFLWAGGEELIREELSTNPEILNTILRQSYKYLEPCIEQSMSAGLNGPSSIHTGKVWTDHFKRNYDSGYYLKPKNANSEEKSEGCFIATYAYNSYEHKEVLILRKYRDEVLFKTELGRKFIEIYYRYSPFLVGLFEFVNFPKTLVKSLLKVIIFVIKRK